MDVEIDIYLSIRHSVFNLNFINFRFSEHRPKKISREVSALVDSRRVSSLLQSDRFMKRLESTLNGVLGGRGKGQLPQHHRHTHTHTHARIQLMYS